MNLQKASKVFGIPQKKILILLDIENVGYKIRSNNQALPDIIITYEQQIKLCEILYDITWEKRYKTLKLHIRQTFLKNNKVSNNQNNEL